MEKEYIIAGNWKMHKTVKESVEFFQGLEEKVKSQPQNQGVEILVFPPFTSLYAASQHARVIGTGAQNLHFEEAGAFTGEISPLMLEGLVQYVLIGHSERREIFHESTLDFIRRYGLRRSVIRCHRHRLRRSRF